MKKFIMIVAVFALMVGARVASTEAFSLRQDPVSDIVKLSFAGVTESGDLTYAPDASIVALQDGTQPAGELFGIFVLDSIKDELNNNLWLPGDGANERIYGMLYDFYDKTAVAALGGGQFQVSLLGGKVDFYINDDNTANGSTEYDQLLGPGGRAGKALYTSITDVGALSFLTVDVLPGVNLLDADLTMTQTVDGTVVPIAGKGTAFGNITGGLAASLFTSQGLTDAQGNARDIHFVYDILNPHDTANPQALITAAGWDQTFNDPTLVNIVRNPIPEPTTVALLGIGLVGMAGVAVRKKLRKKEDAK